VLRDFAKADHEWLEALLGAMAAEAPFLAEGADDKFQSRVAHALQAEADAAGTPEPQAPVRETANAERKAPKAAPKEGPFSILRRWFGS
jgi:peptidyl-tRNA hydrolase, PTH1 family